MCLATPGSTSGSTSVCPWLGRGEMLPAYWPVSVWKFDLILPVLFLAAFNVLTTITAYHLPLHQCVAIAFQDQILDLSVRFIVVPSVVQCYLVHWLNIYYPCQSYGLYDESTVWFRVQHCLKPLRPHRLSLGFHSKPNSSPENLATLQSLRQR